MPSRRKRGKPGPQAREREFEELLRLAYARTRRLAARPAKITRGRRSAA